MKRVNQWITQCAGVLVLGLFVGACDDDGDDVTVESIAPGTECIGGGLRITIDGVAHVACTGDSSSSVLTESVAFGASGNPCPGPALRITVAQPPAAPTVAWVCDNSPGFASTRISAALHAYMPTALTLQAYEKLVTAKCGTFPTPDARANALANAELSIQLLGAASSCPPGVVNLMPEASDDLLDFMDCALPALTDVTDCAKDFAEDNQVCDAPGSVASACLDNAALEACRTAVPAAEFAAVNREFMTYMKVALNDYYSCGVILEGETF